jgi:hypothetical protein
MSSIKMRFNPHLAGRYENNDKGRARATSATSGPIGKDNCVEMLVPREGKLFFTKATFESALISAIFILLDSWKGAGHLRVSARAYEATSGPYVLLPLQLSQGGGGVEGGDHEQRESHARRYEVDTRTALIVFFEHN